MKYYTGMFAITQYADLDENSVGLGSRIDEYFDKRDEYLQDSENSVLGDYGIFTTTLIPTGDEITCASHKRAYLDMLIAHDFTNLKDLYDVAIKNFEVIHDIFKVCSSYKLLNDMPLLKFLNSEFGSNFRSYLLSIGDDEALGLLLEV